MFQNNLLMAAASISSDTAYTIDYSCRFNRAATARLTRTNSGTPTDASKGIVGMWIKRSNLGIATTVFDCASQAYDMAFQATDDITGTDHAAQLYVTTQVFQDPAAWYHIVLSYDSDQEADGDRNLLYINGERVTAYSYYAFSQTSSGEAWGLNADSTAQTIGSSNNDLRHWDGYMSQYFLVDGKSIQNGDYSIASFGEFNNNVWRPIDVTGLTFGTNGYLLDFADSGNLGNDISGNDNDWTPDNMAADDQVTDTPTNNFCTMSSIDKNTNITLSDGNLTSTGSGGWHHGRGTLFATSGKWYYEWTPDSGSYALAGWMTNVGNDHNEEEGDPETAQYRGIGAGLGVTLGNQTAITDVANFAVGDVIMMAIDIDTGEVWVGVDGTWEDDEDPGAGGTPVGTWTSFTGTAFTPWTGQFSNANTFNFGQTAFTHTIPTGFSAWSTNNLPEPTIKNSKKYFDAILYEGNGDTQKVGQFQPITETYSVGNSALFNLADSCNLTRTPSIVGNRSTFTFSTWIKSVGDASSDITIFSGYSGNDDEGYLTFGFKDGTPGYEVYLEQYSSFLRKTDRTYFDTSQWNSFILAYDSTQTTASDRVKIYVNGVEATNFSDSNNPALGQQTPINNTVEQGIGIRLYDDGRIGDYYMAETQFIDGQALTPSSFGEVDSTTNRWIPIEYSASTTTPAISFVSDDSTGVNATTFTFSSQALGAAASDRRIVVAVGAGGGSVGKVTGVTVGGVTATLVVQAALDVEAFSTIWWAAVPTGTTGDVVVTFSSSKGNCGVSCYRLTGADVVLSATSQSAAGSGAASSGTVGTPNNAVVVGNTYHEQGSGATRTTTWSGLTENVDDEIEGGSTFSTASGLITAASVTATATPSGSTANEVFTLASFGSSAYGINGYHLDFADKNDLGDDESGNTNDFAESGFDTTNGSNQFYDTPTRNFAIMDPGRSITETMTKGNLLGTSGGATGQVRTPTAFGLTSGKWYFEFLMVGGSTNERTMYVVQDDVAITTTQIRSTTGHYSGYYSYDGNAMTPGNPASTTGETETYGDTYTAADVISCALDLDIGAIWWGKNGTWQNSATEAEIEAGNSSKAAQTGLSNYGSEKAGAGWFPTMMNNTTQASHANFGQHIYFDSTTLTLDTTAGGYFRHAVPDGFKAIHVDNLTESDSFQSAFSWIKNRDAADNHMNFDRVRGPFSFWHSNDDANIADNVDTLQRFLKQGATLGEDVRVNTANESYVYWDWFIEAAGSGSANEDGSINTASTLVDTTCGFSISKFTGTGANATVGHGLGVAPKFVILKHFDNSNYSTTVGHGYLPVPTLEYLILDTTDAKQSNAAIWNSTIPTSSVVSLGSSAASNNSGTDYMMYCFAEIEGFSRFGTYEGDGNTTGQGPFNYTGFQPEFVIFKNVDRAVSWMAMTSKFGPNPNKWELLPDTNGVMGSTFPAINFLSNGFRIVNTVAYYAVNQSGESYIWCAWAKNPFGGASTTPSTAV